MPNPIDPHFLPHPLSPTQRLTLHGLRRAINTTGALTKPWRVRRQQGLGVVNHRYGTRADETLEILEPNPQVPRRAPVVYVHGGGWIICHKGLYTAELAFLAQHGHRVYNLDYPLAPEHPFPMPLRSLAHALEWIMRREGEETALHLMGDSAGGNLVTMLALLCADPSVFEPIDPGLCQPQRPKLRSVVSLYGVLDRTSWIVNGFPGAKLMLHSYGGPAAFAADVGPECALTPCDLPPVLNIPCLLATGSSDPLAESSRIAQEHWSNVPARVDSIEYPGESHGFFNFHRRPAAQRLRADVIRFFEET